MTAQRTPVLASLEEAIGIVEDGMTVGIGGAVTAGHPMALVRALARRGVRDLTIMAPTGGIEVDLLIAAGCVRSVWGSYVGLEAVAGVCPVFRAAAEAGDIEVRDLDEAHCVLALRAAAQRVPFLPWKGGVGTSFAQLNPALVEFDDPIAGEPLIAVPAMRLDVALVYAEIADEYGNAQVVGTGHMDGLLGSAADRVILQTDRVVSNDVIRQRPERTWYWRDTRVVRAPFGTHPYSSGSMVADLDHLRDYVRAAKGGADALDDYLARHVRVEDHDAYLETVGIRRIASLLI